MRKKLTNQPSLWIVGCHRYRWLRLVHCWGSRSLLHTIMALALFLSGWLMIITPWDWCIDSFIASRTPPPGPFKCDYDHHFIYALPPPLHGPVGNFTFVRRGRIDISSVRDTRRIDCHSFYTINMTYHGALITRPLSYYKRTWLWWWVLYILDPSVPEDRTCRQWKTCVLVVMQVTRSC